MNFWPNNQLSNSWSSIRFLNLALAVLLFTNVAFAKDPVFRDFSYIHTYEKSGFSSKPKSDDIDAALGKATLEIWAAYLRGISPEMLRIYENPDIRAQIQNRLAEIVSIEGAPQIETDTDRRIIQVSGRGVIDAGLLDVIATSGTKNDKSFQDIALGFMILPREGDEVISAGPIEESTVSGTSRKMQEGSLRTEVSGDAANMSANAVTGEKTAAEISTRSSSSTTVVDDSIVYKIGNVVQVTNGMNSFFTGAGFTASPYDLIAEYCGGPSNDVVMNAIVERNSGDLPGKLKRAVMDAAKECDSEFFISGTIDVDTPIMVQGEYDTNAIINIEVLDLSTRIPRTFATIQSVPVKGFGETKQEAKRDAVKNAIKISGDRIVAAFSAAL